MLITFDTDLFIEYKLDANQFLVLKLILDKEYDTLMNYLKENDKLDEFIKITIYELIEKGFLLSSRKEAYDFNNLEVTNNFTKLISGGDLFQELVLNYPKQVTRPDGRIDYLLTDLSTANNIYAKLTQKNKALHDHVLHCLRAEVERREETDQMKYMKRLPKWISERGWESYQEQVRYLQSVNGNSLIGYGEGIE